MYSELIVIIMTGEDELSTRCREIAKSDNGRLFQSSDMALIHRDVTGNVSIETPVNDLVDRSHCGCNLACAFVEAIFGGAGEESHPRLVDAGLDRRFLEDVDHALQKGYSACLIYVPEESLVDTRHYLVILEQLEGILFHTIFHSRVEEALLNIDSQ